MMDAWLGLVILVLVVVAWLLKRRGDALFLNVPSRVRSQIEALAKEGR